MPGPRNSNKKKSKKPPPPGIQTSSEESKTDATAPLPALDTGDKTVLCLTLLEDEMTRCNEPATKWRAGIERCPMHHKQYQTMYKKYKDAARTVDEIARGGTIPMKKDIEQYCDVSEALKHARYLRQWIEAIRVERTGRDIHSRRFFLTVDDGHKIRLKVLAKEMKRALEALEAVNCRACELYEVANPQPAWTKATSTASEQFLKELEDESRPLTFEKMFDIISALKTERRLRKGPKPHSSRNMADVDLINLQIQLEKKEMLYVFEPMFDVEGFASAQCSKPTDWIPEEATREAMIIGLIHRQYNLRVLYYEPNLFIKTVNKVSWKDMVLSDDFTEEDAARYCYMCETWKLGLGLMWAKDAVLEALSIINSGSGSNVANFANTKNRVKILDGWIYNVSHIRTMSNEAWAMLLNFLGPNIPGNMENRFVRLCNTYDDLVGFLSFVGMGMIPSPKFCAEAPMYRNHLSLAGVVIADMVDATMTLLAGSGLLPTKLKPQRRGNIVWAEMERRSYIFGAVRVEPDTFTDSFLNALRAQPDKFHLMTRLESDPGHNVETFGAGPGEDLHPVMSVRQFEAPFVRSQPPVGYGDWNVVISAKDTLYGTHTHIPGYLTRLERGQSVSWFFHFKKFPVKYIIIIDPIPNRSVEILAEQVAWVALQVLGYGKGVCTDRKYAKASDEFFEKCAKERMAWAPKSNKWTFSKIGPLYDD